MPVHDLKPDEEYLIGVFLVGAYQEILGDMHNLFGDTDSVNVYTQDDGSLRIEGVEVHDTIEDMLRYVHLQPEDLISRYLDKIVRAELTSDERGAFLNELKQGLKRSSYLTV